MQKVTKKSVKIDHVKKTITMYRTFAKKAENPENAEYKTFQEIRHEFPDYQINLRDFNKNSKQEHYKGLSYDYMKTYIQTYEPEETRTERLDELEKLIEISHCHSKRYPVIKNWFLERYSDIKMFGVIAIDPEQENTEDESGEQDVAA